MKDKETIVLSSLAIGVGAAALLGVSEVSKADESAWCNLGENCYLGVYPTGGQIIFHDVPIQYQSQIAEAVTSYYWYLLWGYQEVWGNCGLAAPNGTCGCGGTYVVTDIHVYQGFGEGSYSTLPAEAIRPLWSPHNSQCWFGY